MEGDRKKPESETESEDTPSFDEVVRKMLNTPPKPKPKPKREKVGNQRAAGSEDKPTCGTKAESRKKGRL